jgi:hypothetical protein
MPVNEVEQSLSSDPSLVRLLDSRTGAPRCLLEIPERDRTDELLIGGELADPHAPITADAVIEALTTSVAERPVRRLLPIAIALSTAFVAAILLWRRR